MNERLELNDQESLCLMELVAIISQHLSSFDGPTFLLTTPMYDRNELYTYVSSDVISMLDIETQKVLGEFLHNNGQILSEIFSIIDGFELFIDQNGILYWLDTEYGEMDYTNEKLEVLLSYAKKIPEFQMRSYHDSNKYQPRKGLGSSLHSIIYHEIAESLEIAGKESSFDCQRYSHRLKRYSKSIRKWHFDFVGFGVDTVNLIKDEHENYILSVGFEKSKFVRL